MRRRSGVKDSVRVLPVDSSTRVDSGTTGDEAALVAAPGTVVSATAEDGVGEPVVIPAAPGEAIGEIPRTIPTDRWLRPLDDGDGCGAADLQWPETHGVLTCSPSFSLAMKKRLHYISVYGIY